VKVACFGLPGFGNDLLAAVSRIDGAEPVALYTRTPGLSFAYYDIEPIEGIAERLGIPVHYVPVRGEWTCDAADLAIVSSFHRILKPSHLEKFRYCVNIHPSLLPDYRGATPTAWMCRDGVRIVGITAHLMDASIDTGPAIFQRTMLNPCLADHELRKALSFLSMAIVRDIVEGYPDYRPRATPPREGSSHPARTEQDSIKKLLVGGRLFVIDFTTPRETVEVALNEERFHVLGYWLDASAGSLADYAEQQS
jgi:methionyl-tRNA formyltransferase